MPRYVPGTVPVTDDIQQLERFLRDETEQIRNSTDDTYDIAEFSFAVFTVAGYGGIGLDAVTPIADITATWQTLPFDVELIAEPKSVSYALGSNAMVFEEEGVWRINAKVSLEFLEAQAGRRMRLRLQNLSTGVPSTVNFNFSVGRNTDGVNLNFNLLAAVTKEQVGDVYVLQVSSQANTFTAVQAIGSVWDTNHVSEYKGDFFDRVEGSRSRWQ